MKARKLIRWGVLPLCLLLWHRSHAQRFVGSGLGELFSSLNNWVIHLFYISLIFTIVWWLYLGSHKRTLAKQHINLPKEQEAVKPRLRVNINDDELLAQFQFSIEQIDRWLSQNRHDGHTHQSGNELFLYVEQLILLRKELQDRSLPLLNGHVSFSQELHQMPDIDLPLNDPFLQSVVHQIYQHFADPSFGPTELCRVLNMSPSQLHRKLTAITHHTPVQLIRAVRLAHARVLLKKKDASVSEVAYDSGFKDPAYFSRIFSKTFNLSPSEFKDSSAANGKQAMDDGKSQSHFSQQ